MITQNVNKTDDISGIANGTFIYCKELRKGFLKTDLTPLNLTNTTFEFVVNAIETMGVGVVGTDYDSVTFGANLSPIQGEIENSYRLKETIKEQLINLGNKTERVNYINTKKLSVRYFDFTDSELDELDPINFTLFQYANVQSAYISRLSDFFNEGATGYVKSTYDQYINFTIKIDEGYEFIIDNFDINNTDYVSIQGSNDNISYTTVHTGYGPYTNTENETWYKFYRFWSSTKSNGYNDFTLGSPVQFRTREISNVTPLSLNQL